MEEEGGSSSSYEAMMDDQNHNNWEAATAGGYRQALGPGLASPPAAEPALPLLPEANGLLKACDAASKAGAAAAISINTSASKFRECPGPRPAPPRGTRASSPAHSPAPLPRLLRPGPARRARTRPARPAAALEAGWKLEERVRSGRVGLSGESRACQGSPRLGVEGGVPG